MKKKLIVIAGVLAALAYYSNDLLPQTSTSAIDPLLALLPFLSELIPERKLRKPTGDVKKADAKKPSVAKKAATETAESLAKKAATETALAKKAATETALAKKAATETALAKKAATETAESLAKKAATETAESLAQKAATETAESLAQKAATETAESLAKKAATEVAEKATTSAASAAAERLAARTAARVARAAATAAKLAQLTARSASADPVAAVDLLITGVIIALQNSISDLDPEAYRDPRPGMVSYSQLPESVKALFSLIPMWGTLGDFAMPFFEFGVGCPEGTTQEFPGSLCLPKCREGYRGLAGDIFCYKDYGPEWENSKEHSDWPIIPTTLKKIVRTNTGVPLSTCGPNEERNGELCYSKCPEGYHGVGPVCWQDYHNIGAGTPIQLEKCPAGWSESPLLCTEPIGCCGDRDLLGNCYLWNLCGGKTVGRLDNGGTCPSDRERVEGSCYRRCPDGWEHVPAAPWDCRKIGAPGMSIPRGAGSPMKCAEGQTQDSLGLCYNPAPPGFVKSTLGMVETPCPPDSDDALALCTRHSYTRPGNVAFKFGIREHKGADEEY